MTETFLFVKVGRGSGVLERRDRYE